MKLQTILYRAKAPPFGQKRDAVYVIKLSSLVEELAEGQLGAYITIIFVIMLALCWLCVSGVSVCQYVCLNACERYNVVSSNKVYRKRIRTWLISPV